MTLLKEILQINEELITFELEVDEIERAMDAADELGASDLAQIDDYNFSVTVHNRELGNEIIDLIYGENDGARESNAKIMGLED